ncbi:MAG: response regulator [Phycisphaerae bacterium]
MTGIELPPARILIVDDNLQNLELLEAYMELPGIRTTRATNGEEALRRIAEERPDLILLDVMMPRMSGFEVCKQLKSDPSTSDIPVLLVTALAEISDRERGMEVGADDFIAQPVSRRDLLERVAHVLKSSRAQSSPEPTGGDHSDGDT